jgi:hypothetical protein
MVKAECLNPSFHSDSIPVHRESGWNPVTQTTMFAHSHRQNSSVWNAFNEKEEGNERETYGLLDGCLTRTTG